jgi:hypothetical protein
MEARMQDAERSVIVAGDGDDLMVGANGRFDPNE